MDIDYNLIGSRICQRRKELHITQKKLSEMVHVSNTHISSIENGEKTPSLDTLIIICKQLGITMDYLLCGTVYTSLDDEIAEKLKICSIENKQRIAKIIDVFLEEEKIEK